LAESSDHFPTFLAVGGTDPEFDQLVAFQRDIQFIEDTFAKAFLSHHHDRFQVMGEPPQVTALLFGDGHTRLRCEKNANFNPGQTDFLDSVVSDMKKSKSSRRWLDRHFNDEFVKKAQKEGYRSRAVYKLQEIQERDRVIRPGQTVVDLGAAPGGWSQLTHQIVGPKGRVVALDILPMDPVNGVDFILGDFRDQVPLQQLRALLGDKPVDLVISDMAPNVSGMSAVDQPRAIYLCELALGFGREVLRPGGGLVVKIFQGEGFDQYVRDLRASFQQVVTRKPRASRPRSREVYLVAGNYNV